MTLNNSELTHPDGRTCETQPRFDLNQEFEKLAFLTAQAWSDDHPDADLSAKEDFDACVLYVTTEMVIAARAVGGPAGLAIMTGEGSRAARLACLRMLSATLDRSSAV